MCDFRNVTICTFCKPGLIVLNGKCVSACPEGYYANSTKGACVEADKNFEVLYLKQKEDLIDTNKTSTTFAILFFVILVLLLIVCVLGVIYFRKRVGRHSNLMVSMQRVKMN